MEQKTSQGKYYVRARKECILTSKQRILTSKQRVLTWGRRVPASAFAYQGSMPWQANTIHSLIAKLGYRPPTWQCRRGDASPPGEDTPPPPKWGRLPSVSIIYTRGIIPFMFFNTKHKKITLIICSFKAESVLLPSYSFPAKKSLKKFHSLSRWFTTPYAFRGGISQKFLPKTFGS